MEVCAGPGAAGGDAGADWAAATWTAVLLTTAGWLAAGLVTDVWEVRLTVRDFTVVGAGAGNTSLEIGLEIAGVLASGATGVSLVTGGGAEVGAGCAAAVVGSVITG